MGRRYHVVCQFEQEVIDDITSMIKRFSVNVPNDDCLAIYRDSYLSSDAIEG